MLSPHQLQIHSVCDAVIKLLKHEFVPPVRNRCWNAVIYHFCFENILSCIITIFHGFFLCFVLFFVIFYFLWLAISCTNSYFTCFREYPCYPQYSALYVSESISNQTLECSCSSGVQRCPKGLSCLGLSNNVASLSFLLTLKKKSDPNKINFSNDPYE